ncbi:MAG: SpoIIE family protein phosphatase [Desulfobacterales bacterium]|nr:SpoIIE family protein phosphatase [Desulfobacterales bacterium]
MTDAEAASLMLYNAERNVLEFASVKDEVIGESGGDTLKAAVELKMGEGIAGWVAVKQKPLIIDDVQHDPRFFKEADKQTGFLTRNLISVPMAYKEELLGVINVLNSKEKLSFDIEDRELLESFAHLAAVAIIRSRLLEVKLAQQKMEIQLGAAAKIQALFWPELPKLPSGSHAWGVSLPAAFVGGDLYDFIPMNDSSWMLYVADVSDKGLPAALIMVALWSRIRAEALLHEDVDKLLEAVNDGMYNLMAEEGFFATIILGRYWPGSGRLQLVRGGHLHPLWMNKDGLRSLQDMKGLSLGVIPKMTYEKKEIMLSPGEAVLFLTDGVTEAENEQSELFGNGRLMDHIRKTAGPPWGKGLLDAVISWRGASSANDDVTLLEIWRDSE